MGDMTEQIERLALAMGCQCEMEGMKALNKDREIKGLSLAYDECAFYQVMEKWGVKPPEEDSSDG